MKPITIIKTILILLLSISSLCLQSDYVSQTIHDNWVFKYSSYAKALPAKVPGTLHLDLISNNIIEDPYYRDNWPKLAWIEPLDWEYQTTFDVDPEILNRTINLIDFEGLDTHADVYLNEQFILHADNMFRHWQCNVTGKLNLKNNSLRIMFYSAVNHDENKAKEMKPIVLRADNSRIYSRKAQYHYGWDWGPRLVTCGIWKPITLSGYNLAIIKHVQLVQDFVDAGAAILNANIELEVQQKNTYWIEIFDDYTNASLANKSGFFRKSKGIARTLGFLIKNPRLWWCRNMGEPYMYRIRVELSDGSKVIDQQTVDFGIRTIELVQEKDKDKNGTSFKFRLNGVDVFMKGANYIPPDMFMPRVTEKVYNETIQAAIDANFNMLRLWGGGNFENDTFYDTCDKHGILIWHDLMFACGMYPGDQNYTDSVRHEMQDNIKRLRNHPSIAIWVGNNEIQEGWDNWDFADNLTAKQKKTVYGWYETIFKDTIPNVLKNLDPARPYWPSSPLYGYGHTKSLKFGDSHFWPVWVLGFNIEKYDTNVGRFVSEYGMQGMLSMNSIQKFTDMKDWNVSSPVMAAHQRHLKGLRNIKYYMQRYFPNVTYSFQDYVYVTQLMQAFAIQHAVESHRRSMPYCMGTLVWQLNDVWPVTSWAMRDYYGDWKAVLYMAKQNYQNVMISIVSESVNPMIRLYNVYVVSDKMHEFVGELLVEVVDFYGRVLYTETTVVKIPALSSSIAYSLVTRNHGLDPTNTVIRAVITYDFDERYSEKLFYLNVPAYLVLPPPSLEVELNLEKETMEIQSDVLVKGLYIYFRGVDVQWSDNYFDLFPNERKTIDFQVLSGKPTAGKLVVKTLANAESGIATSVSISEV